MNRTRKCLTWLSLLAIAIGMLIVAYVYLKDSNPYRNVKLEEIASFSLCEVDLGSGKLTTKLEITELPLVHKLFMIVSRPRLKKVSIPIDWQTNAGLFLDRRGEPAFIVHYEPFGKFHYFYRAEKKNSCLYQANIIRKDRGVSGDEYAKHVLEYLKFHNLSDRLFFDGEPTSSPSSGPAPAP